jgi:hypothetical protein
MIASWVMTEYPKTARLRRKIDKIHMSAEPVEKLGGHRTATLLIIIFDDVLANPDNVILWAGPKNASPGRLPAKTAYTQVGFLMRDLLF